MHACTPAALGSWHICSQLQLGHCMYSDWLIIHIIYLFLQMQKRISALMVHIAAVVLGTAALPLLAAAGAVPLLHSSRNLLSGTVAAAAYNVNVFGSVTLFTTPSGSSFITQGTYLVSLRQIRQMSAVLGALWCIFTLT